MLAKIKHIEKQWNTYHAVVYIPKPLQRFFPHEIDGPNTKKGKFKTRLSASLKTDILELAHLRSPPIVHHFKAMLVAAKQQIEPSTFDFDNAVKSYSETFKALGSGPYAITHVSHQVPLNDADTVEDMAKINEEQIIAYNISTGKGLATKLYLDEWLGQCEYIPKGKDEAGRFIKGEFCKRFPVFELIDRKELKIWIDDQLLMPRFWFSVF